MVVLATLNAKGLGDPAKFVGNRGDGNLGLIGLGPASRVFTCSLLDSLLTATTKISTCPHMTSYPNRSWALVKEFSVEKISTTFRNRVLNRFYVNRPIASKHERKQILTLERYEISLWSKRLLSQRNDSASAEFQTSKNVFNGQWNFSTGWYQIVKQQRQSVNFNNPIEIISRESSIENSTTK